MNATPTPKKTPELRAANKVSGEVSGEKIMKKNRFLGSLVAMAGAVIAVTFLAVGPVGGQDAPAAPAKGGGKGGGGAKQAVPPGPVPRTKEGKPDMSGFWNGVNPSAATSIEP